MKTLFRYVFAVVFLANFIVICAVAQTETQPNKKTATGPVSGTVTIRGKPAVGLAVRLRTNDSGSSSESMLKGITDQEGKYRIGGIPPGTYQVAPIAWGFVPSELGSETWSGK